MFINSSIELVVSENKLELVKDFGGGHVIYTFYSLEGDPTYVGEQFTSRMDVYKSKTKNLHPTFKAWGC
jgi:hypothetical protein